MIRYIDASELKTPTPSNDNFARVVCVEILTPGEGWTIKMDRGCGWVKTYTLDELIELIYIIENGRHQSAQYQAQTEGMRDCLGRIRSFGVLS
jgi:hypothetical protein